MGVSGTCRKKSKDYWAANGRACTRMGSGTAQDFGCRSVFEWQMNLQEALARVSEDSPVKSDALRGVLRDSGAVGLASERAAEA